MGTEVRQGRQEVGYLIFFLQLVLRMHSLFASAEAASSRNPSAGKALKKQLPEDAANVKWGHDRKRKMTDIYSMSCFLHVLLLTLQPGALTEALL